MVIAIVVLSVTVLLLLVALAFCAVALVDANTRANYASEMISDIDDKRHRGAELVYQKFGYRVPFSDSYLKLEEMKLEQSNKTEGN